MRNSLFGLIVLLFLFSCADEQKPSGWLPEVVAHQPEDVTRNSAKLSGEVIVSNDVIITDCEFVCSLLTGKDEKRVPVTHTHTPIETVITELKAGETYKFHLEVSNELSRVVSNSVEFTTIPNNLPQLGNISLIGIGPVSAALQCSLEDDGGLVTQVGFRFTEKVTGKVHEIAGSLDANNLFTARKSDLLSENAYSVYAYAINDLGQTTSESIEFETADAVFLSEAGMLNEFISEEGKYGIEKLTIAGYLNGSDIRLLRDLSGRNELGEATPGKLAKLNLFDAIIVEGGMSYMESRYTENNTLGYGMFKDCIHLTELVLPATLEVIERNALEGCIALTTIGIPEKVISFTPSPGCTALKEISVSPQNPAFSSINGVLYDKEQTELLFYPQGRTASTFTIPATIRAIGNYAFQYCPVSAINIPHTVKTVGDYAFYASQLEEVVVSDAVETIPRAAFQHCDRLKRVTLGASTLLLTSYCFDGCPLTDLYILADYPPVRQSSAITSADIYKQCVLHVLPGYRQLYRSSASWSDFERIVEDATNN